MRCTRLYVRQNNYWWVNKHLDINLSIKLCITEKGTYIEEVIKVEIIRLSATLLLKVYLNCNYVKRAHIMAGRLL